LILLGALLQAILTKANREARQGRKENHPNQFVR
jgi:hypothetical protein